MGMMGASEEVVEGRAHKCIILLMVIWQMDKSLLIRRDNPELLPYLTYLNHEKMVTKTSKLWILAVFYCMPAS